MEGPDVFNIETDGILSQFDKEDIKVFVNDLFLVFNIYDMIKECINDYDDPCYLKTISRYKELIEEWNKKYRDIRLAIKEENYSYVVDVKYANIGTDEIISLIKQMNRHIKTTAAENYGSIKINSVFREEDGDENSLTIQQDNESLKLIYLQEDMLRPMSPEFRLCTFFGMKDGFNKDIDLMKYADDFSFDLGTEKDKQGIGWQRKFPSIGFY